MTRTASALALILALAACGPGGEIAPSPTPSATVAPTPPPSPTPVPSPSATTQGRDYTPPQLTPEAEKGEKGARNLLLSWAAAMEDRAFDAAYDLFGTFADRTGGSAADYAATFAGYRTVTVAIGDGRAEGAAGSIYYQVPVTLTGTTQDGASYRRAGTITLRRVNDVPGATPAQLRWHLDSLDWTP